MLMLLVAQSPSSGSTFSATAARAASAASTLRWSPSSGSSRASGNPSLGWGTERQSDTCFCCLIDAHQAKPSC